MGDLIDTIDLGDENSILVLVPWLVLLVLAVVKKNDDDDDDGDDDDDDDDEYDAEDRHLTFVIPRRCGSRVKLSASSSRRLLMAL